MIAYIRTLALAAGLLAVSSVGNAARNDVLVIVNENSVDSPQVGEYYAQRRDIDPARVVRVRAPNQFFITWQEFASLRDQILRFGLCPSVPDQERPAACSDWSQPVYTPQTVAALAASTPVRYIVMTRGVPTRMRVDIPPNTTPSEPTSVDNYLRFWLARHFTEDVSSGILYRAPALRIDDQAEWRRVLRPVQPATDLEYVIGRIDGVDLASAKALVDRALLAEGSGPFGKVYPHESNGAASYPAHLAFSLFDEARPECADNTQSSNYLRYAQNTSQGKAPAHCTVKLSIAMPGNPVSRQPLADDAVVYFGDLHGQTIQGGFNNLLNWRKDGSCTSTLCSASSDPAACRATSIDPYREIDTRCVGVAPGFLGFNHQSYPLANFGSWPTAWEPITTNENDVPRVDSAGAAGSAYSAWFDKFDEVSDPQCYPYTSGTLGSAPVPCRARTYIGLHQWLPVTGFDPAAPQPLQVSFQVRGANLTQSVNVQATLWYYFQVPGTGTCPADSTPTPAGAPTQCIHTSSSTVTVNNSATWSAHTFTVTPPAMPGSPKLNQLALRFTGGPRAGGIGFDMVSVRNAANVELVRNGTFNEGYRQAAAGDYGANFLSRLGGTAFWGSLSHHHTLGHSFAGDDIRTLAFLQRGLPLGDAVWLTESDLSGILYGDPLYSPTAIRFQSIADPASRFSGRTILRASAVYGREPAARTTRISVCRPGPLQSSYHNGIAYCDRNNGWQLLGEAFLAPLASTTARTLEPTPNLFPEYGSYLLRLQVSRIHPVTGASQTLNDYYPVKYRYSDAELAFATFSGRVLSSGGHPMVSATVALGSAPVRWGTTDYDGRFIVENIAPGTYPVSASFGGGFGGCTLAPISGTSPITVVDQSVQMDFRCTETGGGINGVVTIAGGGPLARILVQVTPVNGTGARAVSTSTSGFYYVGGLAPGTYRVTATDLSNAARSFSSSQVTVGTSTVTANLRSVRGFGLVSGYVRDPGGAPVPNVLVLGFNTASPGDVPDFSVATNADGYFEYSGIWHPEYALYVSNPDYSEGEATVRTDGEPVTVTIAPLAKRWVAGYIFADAVAVPDASVTLTRPDGTTATTTSTASGYYRFDQLLDGTYRVQAQAYGVAYPLRTVTVRGGNVLHVDFSR